MKTAVIGGGWAGLAAAVRCTQAGQQVTLLEMAPQLGGRARRVDVAGLALDNGQHILIGAYQRTLALMSTVGADSSTVLRRQPLELRYPDGRGLRMPAGPPWLVFGWAVARCQGWGWGDRLRLLQAAAGWAASGFACAPTLTVDRLCLRLPPRVRELLIDPLCVAALNTPAKQASAQVFLRVLRDALFSGAGSADLLLPRQSLQALLPDPAGAWLAREGAVLRLSTRVQQLQPVLAGGTGNGDGTPYGTGHSAAHTPGHRGWLVDGETFDHVVLACTAAEAARLAQPWAPGWAAQAAALRYEPIVTVYLRCAGARLPTAMTALAEGPQAPAQYAFDHGALGASPGVFAFVISGAAAWVARGITATTQAVLQQAQQAFAPGTWPHPPEVLRVLTEKRATFACTPALERPAGRILPGLAAAGDYVQGPYPATLEGAVRAGEAAAASLAVRNGT